MMLPSRNNPRAKYRLRQIQRINNSISLAEKFPKLRSLRVDLVYFDPDGKTKTGELRYKANVEHARSVLTFVCPSLDCPAGNFDLSDAVTEAVAHHRKSVQGEIRCAGRREIPDKSKKPCDNLLRYKLTISYV